MNHHTREKHTGIVLRKLSAFDASDLLGAPFQVVLHDAVKEKYCEKCDQVVGHVVPQHRELLAVTAVLRACEPTKVSGKEIRFLRKSLKAKAKDFAEEISISPEQLSRFENDKQPISEGYEKLLRAAVCLGHLEITYRLGVKASELFSMEIRSARCATETVRFDLYLADSDKVVRAASNNKIGNEPWTWSRAS